MIEHGETEDGMEAFAIDAARREVEAIANRIYFARRLVNEQTRQRIADVLATGPMVNELRAAYEPPTVVLDHGLIVATENFRFI